MEKAAIYLRLSKEDSQKESEYSQSIQNQKNILLSYAKQHEYEVIGIYVDDDCSGLYWERPAFSKMMQDAKQNKFEIILAKTQSRLSRNLEHAEYIMHNLLPDLGIRFIGVVDGVDTSQKSGKKARQINALVNEWYSEDLSESIRSVYQRKMRNGEYLGAYCPFGYKKSDNDHHKLIIDKISAEWVVQIFKYYAQGYSIKAICSILDERKIPTPTQYRDKKWQTAADRVTEAKWSTSTVKKILSNEVYLGKIVQGKSKRKSFKEKKNISIPKSDWIICENMHEPIIDEKLYQCVQDRRNKRNKNINKNIN